MSAHLDPVDPGALPGVPEDEWRAARAAHEARVDRWIAPHLERRRRGQAHPVEDFLFTYYAHRPAALRRWHPGHARVLRGATPGELGPGHVGVPGGAALDVPEAAARRVRALRYVVALLEATARRPAQHGCFGLHEWAMVHRAHDARRHAEPLRLGPAGTDAVVERLSLRCTHVDAVRFFTPSALPRNEPADLAAPVPPQDGVASPLRERQLAHEQPGCVHATMDLYKWAAALGPLVPSELVADCFALARQARRLDMAAGPYDLRRYGLEPLPVETPEGRRAYAEQQRALTATAAPLRSRLIGLAHAALGAVPSGDGVAAARAD